MNANTMTVRVECGRPRLGSTVDSWRERAAEKIAHLTAGVVAVENALRVAPAG